MSENEELKPCPFCGGEAKAYSYDVGCTECDALITDSFVRGGAIAAWNRRTPAPADNRLDALEERIRTLEVLAGYGKETP